MQEQKWLDENSSQVRFCVVFGGRSCQYKLLTEVQFLPPKVVFQGRGVFKRSTKLGGQNSAYLGAGYLCYRAWQNTDLEVWKHHCSSELLSTGEEHCGGARSGQGQKDE